MNTIIEQLINETVFYDFPFMASENKKKEIILEKKLHIETIFGKVYVERFPKQDVLNEIWDEAVKQADESFPSLSPKMKINGFYLQELMHYYSGKLYMICESKNNEEE